MVTEMAANIVKRAECAVKESKEKFVATVSGVTLPSSNRSGEVVMARDVIAYSVAAPAEFATNPITGPTLLGLKEEKIAKSEDVAALVAKCVKGFDLSSDEMLIIHFNFTQVRAPKDVYVTSFKCVFVNHLQKTFNMKSLLENTKARKKEGLLFTSAIGGVCRTAVVVPISGDDAKNMDTLKATLTEGETFNAMKNKPSRSGSLVKLVKLTKIPIEKGAIKDEKMKENMLKMIKAAEKANEDPEKNPFVAISVSKN
ncbi:hypothetical protein AGDE_16172 [Angomonas deanei]|nr:hypothetical protein AGDE_16172 [Angomonas deanei]|eukprot:EPY17584.1 hypothetical protein AGDE_16172 [Angomonas deanei]